MEYDVVIVGAGPAGLAAAIRLRQLAAADGRPCSVCVLEKGSEVGAHILSGAIIETRALDELIPDWKARGAPLDTPVTGDEFHFLSGPDSGIRVPGLLVPAPMHNAGNQVASLGGLCRWLATQAEALGVEIFPGFAAADVLFDEHGGVRGVITGDMGIGADGTRKDGYTPGMELLGKTTIFAEWEVRAERHRPGRVVHGAGWPLLDGASGGFFLYHAAGGQVAVGLIIDLNYSNPWLSPFEEFQRLKLHPLIAGTLAGGRRVAYGARAITKGGFNSLPRLSMPGALLVGCDAGTLNFAKIKGTHTAMKSGMVAAETIMAAFAADGVPEPGAFDARFRASWAHAELERARNFGPALHRLGLWAGAAFNFIDQSLCRGRLPLTLHDRQPDHESLKPADGCTRIDYPKPDGKLGFDRLSSVFISNTNHTEDQPCHLTLRSASVPVDLNLARFAGPEQRYCPAGVYEFVEEGSAKRLQINAQNCVHCKTCDIKDPSQNIVWVTPEGGGGPNYPNM
jgi:electron-transferring-flavoprotein dehydrogenase